MNTTVTFLTTLIFLSGWAAANAATPPQRIAQGTYPDLAVDRAGAVHIVYVREGGLYYRQRPAGGEIWGAEQDTGLRAEMPHRSDPEVATDSQNRPHVLVGRAYAWLEDGKWTALDPGVLRDTALAIDARDDVYVCRRGGAAGGFIGLRVRRAGAGEFVSLPDPDVAGGLPKGMNDHVYAHVFTGPQAGEVHLVYRHGAPQRCAYRASSDGGLTWTGGGINADDFEAPSGLVTPAGDVFVVSGSGMVQQRIGGPGAWRNLGRALSCGKRDLPVLAADAEGNLFVAGFGGRISVRVKGDWSGERRLPAPGGQRLGFVALGSALGKSSVYAVWEEGNDINNDTLAGTAALWFAELKSATVAGLGRTAPPAAAASYAATPAGAVPQWGRFELVFTNTSAYADPYRDVSLDAKLTRPDGSTVRFWGFYDGGQNWRLRFMPDQVGGWKYEAGFSEGAPGVSGTFQCVNSDLPGMLAVHEANPVWFGFKGGDAALIRALHVGDRFFARNWDDPANPNDGEKRAAFLDWAQKQGYNTLSIASHYLNRQSAGRGRGWDTPKLWPLDVAEYRMMEALLDELSSRRIMVYPFAGFMGRSSNFPTSPDDRALYLRYSYARLGPYWNLLLNVAGPEPMLRGNTFLSFDEVNRLGVEIQRYNVFGKPLSVHNRTGDDEFRDQAWLTYGTLQGPKTANRSALSRGLLNSHHSQKPLLAQETLWSGNVNHIRSIKRDYTDDDLRKNALTIHFSAAALVFADNDGDSSSGFSGTLDLNDCRQQRHDVIRRAWDLCGALPFGRLKPRPDLVNAGYCLAAPGQDYLIYLERELPLTVKLEGGPYQVVWIDARQPSRRQAAGLANGAQEFQPPAGGDDWVLWLAHHPRSAESILQKPKP